MLRPPVDQFVIGMLIAAAHDNRLHPVGMVHHGREKLQVVVGPVHSGCQKHCEPVVLEAEHVFAVVSARLRGKDLDVGARLHKEAAHRALARRQAEFDREIARRGCAGEIEIDGRLHPVPAVSPAPGEFRCSRWRIARFREPSILRASWK